MSNPGTLIPILIIIFLAAFVRSAVGFGDALLAMPLLALLMPMQTATPLVALHASTIAAGILVTAWRQVDLKAAWRLIVGALVGVPVGLFLLSAAPEGVVRGLLGLVLVGFGLYNLLGPALPLLRHEAWAYLFGFVGGTLGGAFNTNGPPGVIYGALRRWPPKQFRATMQGYLLPVGLTVVAGHGLSGMWTGEVVRLYLYSLPLTVLGIVLGGLANRKLAGGHFERIVHGFLVLMGVVMLVQAFG